MLRLGRGWADADSILSSDPNLSRKEKYRKNAALFYQGGEICSQSLEIFKRISIGGFSVFCNGCGAIALYNLTMMTRGKADLAKIIHELEHNHALRLNGALGVSSRGIEGYLNAHGFDYEVYKNTKQCRENIEKYPAAIIYIRNRRSITEHYYCVINTPDGSFSLNRFCNQPQPSRISPNQIRGVIKAFCIKTPLAPELSADITTR